ncbi:MAG TPA: hypothetical protein VF211_12115 [Burkholderiales bacterium]
MKAIALLAFAVAAGAAAQPLVPPLDREQMEPGYGVVERVAPVRVRERSAAAGGSAAAEDALPKFRITVRMADGSVQYRDIDRREFRPGTRVLLTNAGDVVADAPRGSTPPGLSQDGARPAEGAIKGGSIAPGERSGVPDKAPGSAAAGASARDLARCYELEGSLRAQCLADESSKRESREAGEAKSGAPARQD